MCEQYLLILLNRCENISFIMLGVCSFLWCVHACNYNVFHTDRVQEGIRELDMLKDKRDINLCATMALMFAHKKSHNVGQSVCVCVCVRERDGGRKQT